MAFLVAKSALSVLKARCFGKREEGRSQTPKKITTKKHRMVLSERHEGEVFRAKDTYTHLTDLHVGRNGRCWVARSKTNAELVVIKRVQERSTTPAWLQKLRRSNDLPVEATMLFSKLRQPHPNIIRLLGVERDPSKNHRFNLFFEYCAAGDLIDQSNKFDVLGPGSPPMFTLHVFVSLIYALAYVHEGLKHKQHTKFARTRDHKTIIHGDIKPDNVFLRWPGRKELGMPDVVLADFGMAKEQAKSTGYVGTQGYESPEVLAVSKLRHTDWKAHERAQNIQIMTKKSDMYQLGLLIHVLAVGPRWTVGRDPQDIVLPEPHKKVAGLMAALAWCLQVDPEDRPECTTDIDNGFLLANELLKVQRDNLYTENGALGEEVWFTRGIR